MGHHKKQSECGSYNYLLYLPEGYDAVADRPQAGWPVLLFLHGADRKGVNLDALRASGIPRLCEERLGLHDSYKETSSSSSMVDVEPVDDDADSPRTATAGLHLRRAAALAQRSPHRRTPSVGAAAAAQPHMQSFPFVVVSPLCPPFKYWRVESLASLLEEVAERYHVDPRRVYGVGEGMGGWAVCALAARVPRCLAACVPIGAATDPSFVDVDRLKDTPLWIFQGSSSGSGLDADSLIDADDGEDEEQSSDDGPDDDDADGMRASVCLVQALRQQGARSVLFTTYPLVADHSSSAMMMATTKDIHNADTLPGVSFAVDDSCVDPNELVKRSYTYDNPLLYQWLLQHSLPLLDV